MNTLLKKQDQINDTKNNISNFDLKRMEEALKTKSTKLPKGLSIEDKRKFILDN